MPNFRLLGSIIKKKYLKVADPLNLFIVDRQWRMAGKPTQPAKDILTYYVDCHVITSLCYY